ncbi:hypothetical protein IQ249_12870 [Lusitaniella coriacea LEGE 07157]|uniref:Uncharacterized protein n=1 Tax=Lusitaniella coriacea LEGE 07157 TaxID=945747 RepID=A0A8J7ITE1_9CYAN|nr:hypothetical protein [Lusitaniella coriacea]MBE9116792.1 hypothetical protein [Lusitaniella coriacea LEGE 07157]
MRKHYNLEFKDFEDIEDIIRKLEDPDLKLPEQLKRNLIILARQARYRVTSAEFKIRNFEKEIAYWFDESMNRASGVYTRNAKGFALLIGFFVAVCANADTLNMINRLNTEPILRSAVNDVAQRVVEEKENCNDRQCLEDLGLDETLSLPVGWDFSSSRYPKLHKQQSNIFLVILGWIFTAIALSMGAPFWFDLLNRFVNVRNTGKKPKTMVEQDEEE